VTRKSLVAAAVALAAAVSWDQYLYPPVGHYLANQRIGLRGTLVELLKSTNTIYDDGFLVGWLFLATTLVLLVLAAGFTLSAIKSLTTYLAESEVPISVVSMDVTVYAVTEDLSRVRVSRTQLFHANVPNTSAFYSEHRADAPSGAVDGASLHSESFIDGRRVTKLPHVKRESAQHIEVIERFDRDLPVSFWLKYLPNAVVRWLHQHSLFKKFVVRREVSVEYVNEYDEPRPIFQLAATRYPVTNIVLRLNFPMSTAPNASEFSAFRVAQNAVEELDLQRSCTHDRCEYQLVVPQLRQADIRVEWENTVLNAWKDAQANPGPVA
jgi:hypothetical protein